MRECAVQFVMYFKCLFNMFGTFACSFLGCKVLAADNASKWMKGFSSGTILKESFDFVVLRKLFHSLQTSANQTQLSIPAHFHRRPIKYWVYYIWALSTWLIMKPAVLIPGVFESEGALEGNLQHVWVNGNVWFHVDWSLMSRRDDRSRRAMSYGEALAVMEPLTFSEASSRGLWGGYMCHVRQSPPPPLPHNFVECPDVLNLIFFKDHLVYRVCI
jgi:hypothetical protein